MNHKEEVSSGVVTGVFVVVLCLSILFLWAPVGYYLSYWSEYWDPSYQPTEVDTSAMVDWDTWQNAELDCREIASNTFGNSYRIYSMASSTKNNYEEYDCYAIPLTKIK